MSALALYALTAVADLLIAIGAIVKVGQAMAYGRRLDAGLWAVFAISAVVLAAAYGTRALVAS